MIKNLLIGLIIIIFVIELGFGFVIYKIDKTAKSATMASKVAGSQNMNKFGVSETQLLAEDVAGSDFAGIVRFPRSVRVRFEQKDNKTSVEYQTHDPEKLVLSYYKTQLAKNNWIIDYAKENEISYYKDNQRIYIQALSANGITSFLMNY